MPLCKDHHDFGVFLKLFLVVVFRQTLGRFICLDVFICVYAANNKNRQPWNIPQPYEI
jgi:hypothetical protein